MAISRVLAVKRFRKQLVRLNHPEVAAWSDRQLKNAIFRNDLDWLELLRWLLGELDEEIKECLATTNEEERLSRIKESILVLGLCSSERIDSCIKGRVIFKERDELVSQLMELVKMKKAIDAGGTSCVVEGRVDPELKEPKNPKFCKVHGCEKTEVLTARELFHLLVAKNPEYQRLILHQERESKNGREDLEDNLSEEGCCKSLPKEQDLSHDSDDSNSEVDILGDGPCASPGGDSKDGSLPMSPESTALDLGSGKASANDELKYELEKHVMAPTSLTASTKEMYGDDSPDISVCSEPSSPLVWNDGPDMKCCTGSTLNLVKKSGAEAKPLNYLEAVHELVNDLERTCQMAK